MEPASNATAPALKKSLAQRKASTELVTARAAKMMTKVKEFCECVGHKNVTQLAQRKQGDDTCESVDIASKDLGIDCSMDGFNITIDMLKNIITDKPTPITAPLNETESAAVQTKSEALPMFDVGGAR